MYPIFQFQPQTPSFSAKDEDRFSVHDVIEMRHMPRSWGGVILPNATSQRGVSNRQLRDCKFSRTSHKAQEESVAFEEGGNSRRLPAEANCHDCGGQAPSSNAEQ